MKSSAALRLPAGMANAGPAAKEARSTHFIFEHKVFSVPNVFFALTEDRKPALHIDYGDLRAAIELRAVRSGFGIPQHSADDYMLGVVGDSLRFVRKIRPNDSIPREVLDGTASWAIDESHHLTAHSRLTLQLASWMTGKATVNLAREQIRATAADPGVVARVQAAVAQIVHTVGLQPDQKHVIVDRIEAFAREFSYVEAIRARFDGARGIGQKVAKLLALYKTDRFVSENLTRVAALMVAPLAAFETMFASADAMVADIIGICRSYDERVAELRVMRDDLFELYLMWEPILTLWQDQQVIKGKQTEESIRLLFQFLARNYPQSSTWKS
ncbi:MAG TPA: hypothetical protein VHM01_09655 [Alphaproteobacteria bacterium]|nr:hypothetical protein [Alphaproteobacteria bacterium]